jgi:hypothetical protein
MSSDLSGDSGFEGVSYNLWFTSMLIGRSIVGIQAGDVTRLARLLKEKTGSGEIYAVALQEMSPVLLHAAAFDHSITQIVLIEPYLSYRSLVFDRFYNSEFIYSSVPGSIPAYDLPDLAASLAPRKLIISGISDGGGNSAKPSENNEDLFKIKSAYQSKNAGEQLSILPEKPEEMHNNIFMEWINK